MSCKHYSRIGALALREGETLLVRPRKTKVFLNAA